MAYHGVPGPDPSCTDWSWLCWIELHPGLAAWVQAIGSILAIGTAVVLTAMQFRSAQRQRMADEESLLAHAYDIAAMIAAAAQAALNSLESEAGRSSLATHGYPGQGSQQCYEAVRAFPGARLQHVEAIRWLRMGSAVLLQIDQRMNSIALSLRDRPTLEEGQVEEIRKRVRQTDDFLAQTLDLAGKPWPGKSVLWFRAPKAKA